MAEIITPQLVFYVAIVITVFFGLQMGAAVMVLPRELIGKSSFQFVNEEDKAKPRVQQYKIFVDAPIARPQR